MLLFLFLFAVTIQQQQRLIQMQRTVVPNRMISSQQIIQQGTVQQTRQLAPPPPYPGPPPPYPGQHQVKLYLYYILIYHCYSVFVVQLFVVIPSVVYPTLHLDIFFVDFQKESMPFFNPICFCQILI